MDFWHIFLGDYYLMCFFFTSVWASCISHVLLCSVASLKPCSTPRASSIFKSYLMPHPRPPSPLNPPHPSSPYSPPGPHSLPSSPPSHSPPRSDQRWSLHRGERNTLQTLGKTFIFRQRFYFCPPDVFFIVINIIIIAYNEASCGEMPCIFFFYDL